MEFRTLFKISLEKNLIKLHILHHLIYQASDDAVLGENLAVVTGQLYSPLCWIVDQFDILDVLLGPLVVFVLAPLCWWQGQPVRRKLENLEKLPTGRSDVILELDLSFQL